LNSIGVNLRPEIKKRKSSFEAWWKSKPVLFC